MKTKKTGQALIDQLEGQFERLLTNCRAGKATRREMQKLDRLHLRIVNLTMKLYLNSQN